MPKEEVTHKMQSINKIISSRKSTRNFDENYTLNQEDIETILTAAVQAPSPKNRQPWYFTVVTRDNSKAVIDILDDTLKVLKDKRINSAGDTIDLTMAQETAKILRQASAIIFISYEKDVDMQDSEPMQWTINCQGFEVADLQSIGASIENMILQATEMSIDSLWVCDILYAEKEIRDYLRLKYPLIAAVALGKASRKPFPEKVSWIN